MAYFALLDGNKVVNVLVADSVAALGEAGLIYTPVDVTQEAIRPSVDWTLENGIWYPNTLSEASRPLWTASGFVTAIDAEVIEETPAVEAPKKKEKSKE